MSTQTYALGQEVQFKDRAWLVVRIDHASTLFEVEGEVVKVDEDYVQLLDPFGEHDFVTINRFENPFKKTSTIKALPNIPWRQK